MSQQSNIFSVFGVEGNDSQQQQQLTKGKTLMERLRALYKEKVKTDSQMILSQKQYKQSIGDSDAEEGCCEETVKEYQEEEKRQQRKIKMNKKRKLKERFQEEERRDEYYQKDQLSNGRNGRKTIKKNQNKRVKVDVDVAMSDQVGNQKEGEGHKLQEASQSQNALVIKAGKVRNIMSLIEEYGEQKEYVKVPNQQQQQNSYQLEEEFQDTQAENDLSNETNFEVLQIIEDLKDQKQDYLNKQPAESNLLSSNIYNDIELRDNIDLDNGESNDQYDNNHIIFDDYYCNMEQFNSKNTDDYRQFVRDQMKYKQRKNYFNDWKEQYSQIKSRKENIKERGYQRRRRQEKSNRDIKNDRNKGKNKRRSDLKFNYSEEQENGSNGIREERQQMKKNQENLIEKWGSSNGIIGNLLKYEQPEDKMKKLKTIDEETEIRQKGETKIDNVNLNKGNQQKQVQLQQQQQTQDDSIKCQQEIESKVDGKLSQQCKILHRRRINKLIPTNFQGINSQCNGITIDFNNRSTQDWDKNTLKSNNNSTNNGGNQIGVLVYERSSRSRKESKNISNYLQQAAKYRTQRGIANTNNNYRQRMDNMVDEHNLGKQQDQGDQLQFNENQQREKQQKEQEILVVRNNKVSMQLVDDAKEEKKIEAKRFAFDNKSNYLNSLRQNKDLLDRKKKTTAKWEKNKIDENNKMDWCSVDVGNINQDLQEYEVQKQKMQRLVQNDLIQYQTTYSKQKKETILSSLDITKERVFQPESVPCDLRENPQTSKQVTQETHGISGVIRNDELVGDIELDVPIVDYRHQFNPLTNNTLFIAKIATLGTTLEMIPDDFQNQNGNNLKQEGNIMNNGNNGKIQDLNSCGNIENINKPMLSRQQLLKRSKQRVTDIKSAKTTLEEIVMRFQKTELQGIGELDKEANKENIIEDEADDGGRIQELEEQEEIEKANKYQRLLALEEGVEEEEEKIKLVEGDDDENVDELERGDLELLIESELHREQDKQGVLDESFELKMLSNESDQMGEIPSLPVRILMMQHPKRLMSKYDKKIFNERVAKEQRRAARRLRAEQLQAERQEKGKNRKISEFIEDQADEAEGDEEDDEDENIIDQKKVVRNINEEESGEDSEDDIDAELKQWIDDAQEIANYDGEDDDYNKQILVRQKYFEQELVDDKKNLKKIIYSVENNCYQRDSGESQKQLKNQESILDQNQKQTIRNAVTLELKDQEKFYGCYDDSGEDDSDKNQKKGKDKRKSTNYFSQFDAPKCADMVVRQFQQKRLNTAVTAAARYYCNSVKKNNNNNNSQANLRKQTKNLSKMIDSRSSNQINVCVEMKIVDDEVMSLVKEVDKENQLVFPTIGSQKHNNRLMKNLGFSQSQQTERKLFTQLQPQKLHRNFSQKIFASFN